MAERGDVTVTVSKQARAQDIARAAAHELVEVQTLLQDPSADRPTALHEKSTSTELSAHDAGRKAELQVLLYELATAPSARHAGILKEIDALLKHLGFDPKTVGTDPRARVVLGNTLVEGVVISRSGSPPPIRGAYPRLPAQHEISPTDVDIVVVAIRRSPLIKDPDNHLDNIARNAKLGQEGALGELQAIQRWVAEGRTVEVLKEVENQKLSSGRPKKNPDFLVDGSLMELKTREKGLSAGKWIKQQISEANKQIKRSDPDPLKVKPGSVELQLHGPIAKLPLGDVERQVRSELTATQNRHIKRVAVYHDGALVGEWIRVGAATVRRFP